MENNGSKKGKRLSWKSVIPIVAISTVVSSGISAGIAYAFATKFKYDVPSFTIKFVNNDGSLIKQYKVDLGSTPKYDGAEPTYKNPEHYVKYTFKGWDRDITPAVSDTTYTATFDAVHQTYTAVFYANKTDTSSFNSYKLNKGVYPKSTDEEWQEPPQKQPEGATQYTFCSFQPRTEGFEESVIEFDAVYDEAALGLTFTATNDQVTIESFDQDKYLDAGGSPKLVLPEEWDNKPVTRISDNAFKGCDHITTVTLPNTITTIGDNAFEGCSLVSEINLPNNSSFKTISANTFKNCSNLENIEIPDSVTRINDNAFEGCSNLKTFSIGKNVSEFNPTAISECTKLSKIEVDSSNTNYMSYNDIMLLNKSGTTIYRCVPNLSDENQTITWNNIPSTVTTISANAFASCNVKEINFKETNVNSVGPGAFRDCENLITFSTGNVMEALSDNMLAGCINLYTLELGSEVDITKISSTAFGADCTQLTVINVSNDNDTLMSSGDILYSKVKTGDETYEARSLLRCPPNKDVRDISIPPTVNSIAGYAFKWNISETISLPEGIETIGQNAFQSCANLKTLELPNSVTSIGANAADNCVSLETIKLGSSIDYLSISPSAMVGCSKLKEIIVNEYNQTLLSDDGILYNKADPEKRLADKDIIYRCPPGKDFPTGTIDLDGVKIIADYAFKDTKIESISIPTSVTKISNMAFNGCNQLTSVTFEKDLPNELASNAFKDDENKIEFYFKDSFTDIDGGTAAYISTLQKNLGHPINVKLGCSAHTIGKQWFINCTSINELSFDSTVTGFGEDAFANCSFIQKLTLTDNITTIGDGSFRKLSKLTSLNVPGSVLTIANSAFASITQCEEVIINEGTETIGGYAFDTYQKLEKLVLPTTLTAITDNAFQKASTETLNRKLEIYFTEGKPFTKDQWLQIVPSQPIANGKFGGGGVSVKLIVHCTDGDITWDLF